MGFQFSLAAVLRVRSAQEEREERILQEISGKIAQTLEMIAGIDAEISATSTARRSEVFKSMNGIYFRSAYAQIEDLKRRRDDLAKLVEELRLLREKQLTIYEGARRNRELLSGMRDERQESYEYDLTRREQRSIDDRYMARRGRAG